MTSQSQGVCSTAVPLLVPISLNLTNLRLRWQMFYGGRIGKRHEFILLKIS